MAKRPWATYKPSKDGKPETEALKALRWMTYDAAMSVNAICLRRKIEALKTRLDMRSYELDQAKERERKSHDLNDPDRDEEIRSAQDDLLRAEVMFLELSVQLDAAIGAAVDRGLIEFDD